MPSEKPVPKSKECIMILDSRSTDAVRQANLVFNKPGIQNATPLSTGLKHRLIAGAAAAMLAFAVGLLVAVFGSLAADPPTRPQTTVEPAGASSVRRQPTAREFAPPNQPDVSASDARDIDCSTASSSVRRRRLRRVLTRIPRAVLTPSAELVAIVAGLNIYLRLGSPDN